jgi:hypothetical protein
MSKFPSIAEENLSRFHEDLFLVHLEENPGCDIEYIDIGMRT